MINVIGCEPITVGCSIEKLEKKIEFRNHRGFSTTMLDKILRSMKRQGLTIVPKFL